MSARHVDRAIEALARNQHGVFTRRQALLLGATSSLIDRRLSSGAWLRLAPGVYALPGNPPTWRRQLKAAELSVVGAGVCGGAGAALQGLTGYRPARPEIVVPLTGSARNPLAVVRRYAPGRLTTVDGIRVVTAAQALVDVAPTSSRARLARALDDLVVGDAAELDEVRARYLAARGRPGLTILGELLIERGDGEVPTESELEVALRQVFTDPRLPEATWQASVPWWADGADGASGGRRRRVDALVEPWRLVVEADGRRWHTRVADFERDRARDLAALRHGHVVARFTWSQLTRRPAECVAALLDIGAARSVHSGSTEPPFLPGPSEPPRRPSDPATRAGAVQPCASSTIEQRVVDAHEWPWSGRADTRLNRGWNPTVAGLCGPEGSKCGEIPHGAALLPQTGQRQRTTA